MSNDSVEDPASQFLDPEILVLNELLALQSWCEKALASREKIDTKLMAREPQLGSPKPSEISSELAATPMNARVVLAERKMLKEFIRELKSILNPEVSKADEEPAE
jgi:hypothetical protein